MGFDMKFPPSGNYASHKQKVHMTKYKAFCRSLLESKTKELYLFYSIENGTPRLLYSFELNQILKWVSLIWAFGFTMKIQEIVLAD